MRNERGLASRAARGDADAFAAIFRRYQQDLYRYCAAILGNPQDAQDALQNTMVKALAALPGERRQIELKPWLYRVAHNESIELRRRQRPSEPLAEDVPAPGVSLEQTAADRGRLRDLLADLGKLPERQRGALVMRELAGLDFEEIGAALQTTPGAARQVLYEARRSLQQMNEGREMDCDVVTAILSEKDGRVIRRRDVRAHLRDCQDCRLFAAAIPARAHLLASISPLPVAVATAIAKGALAGAGGGGASTGGAAGVAGGSASGGVAAGAAAKAVSTGAVLKSAAGIVAIVAVGAVAVDHSHPSHRGAPTAGGTHPRADVPADRSTDPPPGGAVESGGRTAEAAATARAQGAKAPAHRVARAHPRRPLLVPARPAGGSTGAGSGGATVVDSAPSSTGTDMPPGETGRPQRAEHPAHPRHPAHPSHPSKPAQESPPPAKASHPEHPSHPVQPTHPDGGSHPEHPSHPESPGADAAASAHPAHPEHPSTPSTEAEEPPSGTGVSADPAVEAITGPGKSAAEGAGTSTAPGQAGKAK